MTSVKGKAEKSFWVISGGGCVPWVLAFWAQQGSHHCHLPVPFWVADVGLPGVWIPSICYPALVSEGPWLPALLLAGMLVLR